MSVLSQQLGSYRILFDDDNVKALKFMIMKSPEIPQIDFPRVQTFLLSLRTWGDSKGTHFDVVISGSSQHVSSPASVTED